MSNEKTAARTRCDGNHGGPRCADPDCWNDSQDIAAACSVPDRLYFSSRNAIAKAAGVEVTAECNAIIQATLDHLRSTATTQAVPEIDYPALIRAAFATDKRWAQGTNGCSAFARGAEWFRAQVVAAALSAKEQS